MSTAVAQEVPSGPPAYYRSLRREGRSHDEALREVARSYGRNRGELEARLASVRAECESPPPPVEQQEPAPVEPDEFTAAAEKAKARIGELSGQRATLALDALHDGKAAAKLAACEDELAAAGREYERAQLARQEQQRRDQAQLAAVEQTARGRAQARADELGAQAAKVWGDVEAAARAFADAVAEHAQIAAEQSARLADAGLREASRANQGPGAVRAVMATACHEARADVRWLGNF